MKTTDFYMISQLKSDEQSIGELSQAVPNLAALPPNILPISVAYWEQGTYSGANGQPTDSTARLRMKEFINVTPATTYTATRFLNGQISIYEYDENGTFIRMNAWWATTTTFTTTATTAKIKVVLLHTTATEETTTNDLMTYYKFSLCKRTNSAPYWQYPVLEDLQYIVNKQAAAMQAAIVSLGGNI